MLVYGIPNCNTVKKARQWLDAHDVSFVFHDYKKAGVPADRLSAWIAQTGWEALINRRGTTWRQLPETTRAGMTDAAAALRTMVDKPSLIRRPLIERDGRVLCVGFDEAEYTRLFA